MRTRMPRLAVLGGALAVAAGCSDNTVAPELLHGAGIRLSLPAGAGSFPWLRVELWDDNVTPPPDCAAAPSARGPRILAASAFEPDPVTCERKEVVIWNLEGDVVLHLPDVPFDGRLPVAWDGLDDRGNPAPSGYYPTFAQCLDGAEYTFTGAYFLWQDTELGSCQWPLWIRTLEPAPTARTVAFGPFPESVNTTLFDDEGKPKELVVFENPFLVRVHAPGMQVFEEEITLETGKFADVTVTFAALPDAPATERDGTKR